MAVCDIDRAALDKAVSQTGATGYTNLGDMLAHSNADVVVLATPSGLHPDQAIQVANSGCHVMTEKPMATRWADGKRMVAACDAAGVRLFVVKQNRRNATLQLLKRAVEKDRFGRIYLATINVFWSRPQSYYDSAAWRGTWEFDGGAFMNQASHYVDLLDWLIGPIESVQAYTGTLARNIEVEDTGVMSVRWRSGALGSVNVTMLTYPKNMEGSITILGEKGTVRVGGVAVNEIQTLGVCRARCRRRTDQESELRDHVGVRLRTSALLRERDQRAARRGGTGHRRAGRAEVPRSPDRVLSRGTRRLSGSASTRVLIDGGLRAFLGDR